MTFREILLNSEEIKNIKFATNLYRSLCNQIWYDTINDVDISFSWRASGGFVADIRNEVIGTNENYMDFYCSGNEGEIFDDIKIFMNKNNIVLLDGYYENESPAYWEKFKTKYRRDNKLNKLL